jgi:hypothetical protein
LRVLDPPLDVEPVALVHPLLDDIDEPTEKGESMPLGLLLLLPGTVGPAAVGGEGELGHPGPRRRGADLGIVPDVANEHDLVE